MLNGLIQQLNNFGLPQEMVVRWSFYLIAGLTVVCALRIVTSRNIFHSAIFLAMTLIGIAGVYVFLEAEFLAVAQVLIYVGAIVTLFLFTIMLTADIQGRSERQMNAQTTIAAVSAGVLLFFFVKIMRSAVASMRSPEGAAVDIAQLGRALMTTYVLPFELLSVLLTAVLVGAIIIAKVDKK